MLQLLPPTSAASAARRRLLPPETTSCPCRSGSCCPAARRMAHCRSTERRLLPPGTWPLAVCNSVSPVARSSVAQQTAALVAWCLSSCHPGAAAPAAWRNVLQPIVVASAAWHQKTTTPAPVLRLLPPALAAPAARSSVPCRPQQRPRPCVSCTRRDGSCCLQQCLLLPRAVYPATQRSVFCRTAQCLLQHARAAPSLDPPPRRSTLACTGGQRCQILHTMRFERGDGRLVSKFPSTTSRAMQRLLQPGLLHHAHQLLPPAQCLLTTRNMGSCNKAQRLLPFDVVSPAARNDAAPATPSPVTDGRMAKGNESSINFCDCVVRASFHLRLPLNRRCATRPTATSQSDPRNMGQLQCPILQKAASVLDEVQHIAPHLVDPGQLRSLCKEH